LGGDKLRINDFTKFAQLMNWDFDSPEYISAFKAYNDGLIEVNRQVEKSIADEINSLGDAKGGDLINVTQLATTLSQKLTDKIINFNNEEINISLLDEVNGSLE